MELSAMTTIDRFTNGFNLSNFSMEVDKIDATDYNKASKTITIKTPKILSVTIAVIKNTRALLKLYAVRRMVKKFFLDFQVTFLSASDLEKIELYAAFNQITETLNDVIDGKDLPNIKGGLLTRVISDEATELKDFVNKTDEGFFKIAYPEHKDHNDQEFIKEIYEAHKKSSQYSY